MKHETKSIDVPWLYATDGQSTTHNETFMSFLCYFLSSLCTFTDHLSWINAVCFTSVISWPQCCARRAGSLIVSQCAYFDCPCLCDFKLSYLQINRRIGVPVCRQVVFWPSCRQAGSCMGDRLYRHAWIALHSLCIAARAIAKAQRRCVVWPTHITLMGAYRVYEVVHESWLCSCRLGLPYFERG